MTKSSEGVGGLAERLFGVVVTTGLDVLLGGCVGDSTRIGGFSVQWCEEVAVVKKTGQTEEAVFQARQPDTATRRV